MSRIACIGSRETPPDILRWMENAGREIVRAGHTIVSGNAVGADQAWARGGNSMDPTKVELILPWWGFQRPAVCAGNIVQALQFDPPDTHAAFAIEIMTKLYKRWSFRNEAVQRLLARNVLVIQGASRVLGYVNPHRQTSGTGLAFEIARYFDIPVIHVADPGLRLAFDEAAISGAIFP